MLNDYKSTAQNRAVPKVAMMVISIQFTYIYVQWRAQASGGAGAKWRYEGTIVDPGRGGGIVCSPSARGITIHDFITILCHVGFSLCVWCFINIKEIIHPRIKIG